MAPPHTPNHPVARRQGLRRALALMVLVVLVLGAITGCAGRKGRNDDDPRPNEYSTRLAVELLPGS